VRVGNHVYMMCADPAGRALAPMSVYVSVCERESVYVCVRERESCARKPVVVKTGSGADEWCRTHEWVMLHKCPTCVPAKSTAERTVSTQRQTL